ncbi:hypothetical protein [Methylovirgula sp. HY1]|uniref:hypothetical protein n=1 Tax=Methylovirgula sp. HY1 TaxID=2822761 RepID=UPI001C5AFCA8|nr:hypothetical protein [Methylovirgula sp. HY1]QXX74240.1 hypothetical protein MHY1_01050 [Methylovirgula sp. HY1]
MPSASLAVIFDDSAADQALGNLDDAVRAALMDVQTVLRQELQRRIAAALPSRTGAERRGLTGSTYATDTGVWSEVIDPEFYASFDAEGADIPAHEILPNVAQALSFMDDGHHVITGRVQSPGGHIAARPIQQDQLEAMADEIEARMQAAVARAHAAF